MRAAYRRSEVSVICPIRLAPAPKRWQNLYMRTLAAALVFAASLFAADPVPLIFDTDMGNDVDDALALAMIHSLESRGEAKLLAVTLTKDNRHAAPYIDLVNVFYRRPAVPVGMVRKGKTPEDAAMIRVPVERKNPDGSFVYPRRLADSAAAPDALDVLRKALNAAADNSVVIAQVGFSTNLARLLASDAALIRRKVRLLSVMFGHFPVGRPEYNVKTDIPAAQKLVDEWPTPIVFSGFEIGEALLFPATSVEREFAWAPDHPVVDAYRAYQKMPYNRPTWDLTSVLYAVRPESKYFNLSAPGKVTVDEKGQTRFAEASAGRHRYLILDPAQKARTLEALILLSTQPR
jgi:inosine-uridine nucleoside N-ribohydrolase